MPRPLMVFLTGLALVATAATTPAHADFFSLDGRFECLDHANAVCGDARLLSLPRPAPLARATSGTPGSQAPALSAASGPQPMEPASAPAATTAGEPLYAIASRIAAGRVASGDLAALKDAAERGNVRAVELLAWCALNAIGERRDPIEAYLLYGVAASAALPQARENQTAIYEGGLDSHQRQLVLDLANEGVAAAQPPH